MSEKFIIGFDVDHEIFDVLRKFRDYSDDDITLPEYLIVYRTRDHHYENIPLKLVDLVKIAKLLDISGYWGD